MAKFPLYCFFLVLLTRLGEGYYPDKCKVSRCEEQGPEIRFPFWLKHKHHSHNNTAVSEAAKEGYPEFELMCNDRNQTVLTLPHSVNRVVLDINYTSQIISLYDGEGCLLTQLMNLNLSASSTFQLQPSPYFYYELQLSPQPSPYFYNELQASPYFYYEEYAVYNCSARRSIYYSISCFNTTVPGYEIRALSSNTPYYQYDSLTSCTRIGNLSAQFYVQRFGNFRKPFYGFYRETFRLKWSKPNSPLCHGQYFQMPPPQPPTPKGSSVKLLVTAAVSSVVLVLVVVVIVVGVLYRVNCSHKMLKEDEAKIEKFLEDYRALKPSRYSYADIKKITNQFKEKLGEGGYGIVFKGKLSNEVFVAVKVLNESKGNGEEFINEVGTIGTIHHVNVVRLVGFCADAPRRALVYEFCPNDSLEKFIFSKNPHDHENSVLSWEKLQDIALGIAKGIEYLHQGCVQRILHFDIKPQNILLDQNFNPKVCDFGLAKLCSKEQSIVSMTAARGTMGYIAPEVFSRNFGNVSHKSDVYSFGMLLLEMVGGRKNMDNKVENTSQIYFPEWIYNHLNQGEVLGMMSIEVEEHAKIADKLAIVGLWCIQWYPVDRPSMKAVVQMLENDNNMTMPPNPFASAAETNASSIKPARAFTRELEVISE